MIAYEQSRKNTVTHMISTKEHTKGPKRLIYTLFFMAILLVSVTYSNSLHSPFFFDDLDSIVSNQSIRSLSLSALEPPANTPVSGRPLVNLSFAINYAFSGLNVTSYHIANIILHLFVGFLLWGILRRILLNIIADNKLREIFSFSVVFLFLSHPLQSESVNYITQRTTLLMALFYLASIYSAIRYLNGTESKNHLWGILAVGSAGLSMLSKESAVTLPLVTLLLYRFTIAQSWKELLKHRFFFIALFASWIPLAMMVLTNPREVGVGLEQEISVWSYFLTSTNVVSHYVRLVLYPHPLVVDYYGWPLAKTISDAWVGLAFILPLVFISVWSFIKTHRIFLCIGLPLILISPSSSFVPITTEIAAERRMYLSIIPLLALFVFILYNAIKHYRYKERILLPITIAISLILATISYQRNNDYQSVLTIWKDNVAKRPHNARAQSNLGYAYSKLGKFKQAKQHYMRALELNPQYSYASRNLALVYQKENRTLKAKKVLIESIKSQPKDPQTYYALALIEEKLGNTQAFQHMLKRALKINPDHIPSLGRYSLNLAKHHQCAQALSLIEHGYRHHPQNAKLLFIRGEVYLACDKPVIAIKSIQQGLKIDRKNSSAYTALAIAYLSLNELSKAEHAIEKALVINPLNKRAQNVRKFIKKE